MNPNRIVLPHIGYPLLFIGSQIAAIFITVVVAHLLSANSLVQEFWLILSALVMGSSSFCLAVVIISTYQTRSSGEHGFLSIFWSILLGVFTGFFLVDLIVKNSVVTNFYNLAVSGWS